MSSLFGFGGPVCLLAVLWAAVLCGAVRDPPSADLEASLSGKLHGLTAQLGGLAAQVGGLTTQLGGLSAQTTQLSVRLDNQSAQLAELLAHNTQQNTQLAQLSAHNTQLAQLSGRLDNVQEGLPTAPVRDCSDLPAGTASGVHLLQPGLRQPVPAYCDLDTDGGNWTVVQRRDDIQPRQDFYLGWQDYKWGLGVLTGEFWWGLEHLWGTTALLDRRYELRVDMEDFDGEKRHALYQGFRVSPEADGYRLTVANYSGDAGDSLSGHSGFRFSTKEKDQDISSSHCAQLYKGGWWFEKCHWANLNGLYLSGEHESYADGVNWHAWKGYHYSFKTVVMKIRPSQKL